MTKPIDDAALAELERFVAAVTRETGTNAQLSAFRAVHAMRDAFPALLARVRRGDAAVRVAEAARTMRLAAREANAPGPDDDAHRAALQRWNEATLKLNNALDAYEAARGGEG